MSKLQTADAIVDEVRRIRSEVAAPFGEDMEGLFDHLREVSGEYAERKGVFAGVSLEAAAKVAASWGDLSGPVDDRIVASIRDARQRAG